jgi:Ras-related protein Rab-32
MEEDIKQERMLKILVVGGVGTGKSCWIKRLAHNIFSTQYKSTVGVDFALKVLNWSDELTLKLQLWDIAGQERFQNMTRQYYKEAVAALVMFDVHRINLTLEDAKKWKLDLDTKVTFKETDNQIPVILVANKIDTININKNENDKWEEEKERLDKLVVDYGFFGWVETSAKDNIGIDDTVIKLVTEVLRREAKLEEENNVPLNNKGITIIIILLEIVVHNFILL